MAVRSGAFDEVTIEILPGMERRMSRAMPWTSFVHFDRAVRSAAGARMRGVA